MKPTYELIMLDKPILVNEEEIKENTLMYDIDGDIGTAIGTDESQWIGNKKIIAGHEGTKRLTFQLSDEDAKRIGYMDMKGLAALEAVAKYPTLHNAEFKSDAAANVLTKLCRSAFELGAETYASLTPKKYTEEDLEYAFNYFRYEQPCLLDSECKDFKELKVELSQRKPKQFKVECTETENEIIVTKIIK